MLNRAEAAPSSATPNQNHSAPGDRTQSRPPAAVLAFPVRSSNHARACVANLDLSPGCRITANTIADFSAVHSRPMKYRHIESGDCAAYPAMAAIRRKRPGRRKVCLRTIQNHIAAFLAAADAAGGGVERRRTTRTNTYVFTLPEQPQKQPEIRAEIADNCYPLCYPECGPIEPRREEDQEQVQVQKNRARATTTTTTATTAVRTDADSTGRDPGPSCAPETPPPARRSPVKATPATPAQLDYLALLADGVGIDRPDPSTLTTRSADHLIRDLKPRYARREERRRHGDRRCKSVPRAVKAQIERTDRSAPIHGCARQRPPSPHRRPRGNPRAVAVPDRPRHRAGVGTGAGRADRGGDHRGGTATARGYAPPAAARPGPPRQRHATTAAEAELPRCWQRWSRGSVRPRRGS